MYKKPESVKSGEQRLSHIQNPFKSKANLIVYLEVFIAWSKKPSTSRNSNKRKITKHVEPMCDERESSHLTKQ